LNDKYTDKLINVLINFLNFYSFLHIIYCIRAESPIYFSPAATPRVNMRAAVSLCNNPMLLLNKQRSFVN